MPKLFLAIACFLAIDSSLFASSKGEELFTQTCMVCHPISRPKNRADMVAPPAKGVMFHLSQEMKSDEDILKHIESFVMNPTKEKAICRSVKRFGLMPSQKENITSQELHTVAQWMIDNLKMSQKEYKNRKN